MADRPVVLGERRARLLVQLGPDGLRRELDVAVSETSSDAPDESEALAHVRRVADLLEASARSAEPVAGAELVAWILRATERALETGNAEALSAELALIRGALAGAPPCTGIVASWCPNCGDCSCGRTEEGDLDVGLFHRETGERIDAPYLEVTWPEGGNQTWSPPDCAPGSVLRALGLVKRADGMPTCPLHAPDSPHGERTDDGLAPR